MLNAERKHQYFEDCHEKRRYVIEIMGDYEEEIGKDLCEMNASETTLALEKLHRLSLDAVRKDVTTLRRYLKWCISKDIPVNGSTLIVTYKAIQPERYIKDLLIKDNTELAITNSVFPVSEGYYDLVLMNLVWSGITVEQALDLNESDVLFAANGTAVIDVKGKTHRVSKDIADYIRTYMSVESADRYNRHGAYTAYPNRNGKLIYTMFAAKSGLTMRGVCATMRMHSLETKLEYDLNNVGISGRFYRYHQHEVAGTFTDDVMKMETRYEERTDLESEKKFYSAYRKVFWGDEA